MPPIPKPPPRIPGDLIKPLAITALGDSRTSAVGNFPFMADSGYISWLVHRLNGRLQYVERCGAGGATTAQVLADYLPLVFTRSPYPAFVTVLAGTNDFLTVPRATTIANLTAIYKGLRARRITPVCVSELPRDTSSIHDDISAVNAWMANHAREHGYLFVNVHRLLVDPTNGNWQGAYSTDGVHPTNAGAKIIGQAIADAISAYLPPWEVPLVNYDADPANGHLFGTFANGFTDAGGDGLPDGSPPQTGLFFQGGSADCALTFTDRNGAGDRWLNIERIGNVADTHIRSGSVGTSGFSTTAGGKLAVGLRFKLTGMGAGNSVFLWVAQSNSSTRAIFHPLYDWDTDIDDTIAYAVVDVPADWSDASRFEIQLKGPAGPTLSVAQLTARNLTALGIA